MAPRTTFLDVPDTVILAPGPGHYYPEVISRDRAKGGSTIANMVGNPLSIHVTIFEK